MANWIKVPILCNTENTAVLKDLGIDIDDSQYIERKGFVNTDMLVGVYETEDKKHTICEFYGTSFEVCIPLIEFQKNLT